MEEKILKIIKISILLFMIAFVFSCKKNKDISVLEKAILMTENNKIIKDSLIQLKNKGINFVVCYANFGNEYNTLSFNLVNVPERKKYPYNIKTNFEIKTIKGVDVLYEDFNDNKLVVPSEISNKTKELLDKKIISFSKKNRFIDCDFIEFIICKNDESVFKSFNTRMEIDEQKRARSNNEIYHREVFYPKCE